MRLTIATTEATAETILLKRSYGTLRLASGERTQVPLTEERKMSEALLRRLQTTEDKARARGLTRSNAERQRPINELVTEYPTFLCAKENMPEYVETTRRRLRKLVNATKTTGLPAFLGQVCG